VNTSPHNPDDELARHGRACAALAAAAGLLLAAALGACAGNSAELPQSGASGRIERLVLQPVVTPDGKGAALREIAAYDLLEDRENWEFDADSVEAGTARLPGPDGKRVRTPILWLKGGERLSLTRSLADVPEEFNQVVITCVARGDKKDTWLLLKGQGYNHRTEPHRFPGQLTRQQVIMDVGVLRQKAGAPSKLRLFMASANSNIHTTEVGLIQVSLLAKPILQWLPEVTTGPDMVSIGASSHRSLGLSSKRPLRCKFTPRAGETLSFVYGAPQAVRRPEEFARIRLHLAAGDVKHTEFLALEKDLQEAPVWHSSRVELEPFAGKETLLRFDLEVRGEEESVVALGEPLVSGPSEKPRSVLLITSDTHRADYVGYAPDGVDVATPWLDSLAARGASFTNCYSTTNITNPSHVAILTGTSPRDTGVVDNISPLSASAPTLAEQFREAGYITLAALSANHLAFQLSGLGQGFDRMSAPDDPQRDSTETIAIAREWLAEARWRPVFLWLHVFDAHSPYLPPPEYTERYWDQDRDPFDPAKQLPPGAVVPWIKNLTDLDYAIAQYKGEVSYLDDQLADFIAGSRFEDGVIALTSDHGESFSAHKIYFQHKGLFPNTLGVPLILAGPGVPSGLSSNAAVSTLDVSRTLLDLTGQEAVEFPGRNLLGQADGASEEPRFAISSHGHDASVRVGPWHLVLHLHRPSQNWYDRGYKRHEVQLYNVEQDPRCLQDLGRDEEHAARAKSLRKRLVDWLLAAKEEGWNQGNAIMTASEAQGLEALGYAAESRVSTENDWFDPECACDWCEYYDDGE